MLDGPILDDYAPPRTYNNNTRPTTTLARPINRNWPSRSCDIINRLLRQLAGLTNGIKPSKTRYSANAANKSLQIIANQTTRAGTDAQTSN